MIQSTCGISHAFTCINVSDHSKFHFHQSRPLKLIKTMLKSFPFRSIYRYPNSSHTTETTKQSIIGYGEIEDIGCKEKVS